DLLETPWIAPFGAVMGSTLVFAGAHYVRSVKRRWTVPGHLILGLMLSIAFLVTRNLWFAAGLHAGGILMNMGARPILKYRGSAWLIGESIYPYAGVIGVIGLTCLTAVVYHYRP